MLLSQETLDHIREAIAADASWFADVAHALKVGLITNNINPTSVTLIGDLTLGAGDLAPIPSVLGAALFGFDPVEGKSFVEINPPLGGFRWDYDGGPGAVTVYGFAILASNGTKLLGCEMTTPPVALFADTLHQIVEAPSLRLWLDPATLGV